MPFKFFLSLLPCFYLVCLYGQEEVKQVVILGSGPAGLTAALYTARADLSTLVIEGEEPGGQIALSPLVENFPGFPQGIHGYQLGKNVREQALYFGATIQTGKVVHVELKQRPFILELENGKKILAETLIIASGASSKWLGLDSEKQLIGKGVCSCAVCDAILFKNKEVVVVGGGEAALEDALYLANYASKVTLIVRKSTLKASKFMQNKAFAHPKIHFIWNHTVEQIEDLQVNHVTGVRIKSTFSSNMQFCPCQGVFIAIGHHPNTFLFKNQLSLTETGYIITHPFSTHTTIPGVFAAGDVADDHYRQAITAAGTGCMAGIDAYHFIQKQTDLFEETRCN